MTTQTSTKWNATKLGDIADVTSSKRIFASDYVESGIPFYRSREIIEKNNGNHVSTELYISKEKFESIKSKFGAPKVNDLLLTSVGTLGVPYLVKENETFYFKDGNLMWFRDFNTDKIVPKFVYYSVISPDTQKRLRGISIGSSQSAFTISAIKDFNILLPDISTQKQIADVLSIYDDLIENNNRRIKILEDIAQKIYTEWFVDFRFPGHQNVKLSKDGLPEGWGLRKLRDVVSYYIGGGWGEEEQSENFDAPGFVIRGTDIPSVVHGDNSTVPFRFHKESNLRSRKAEPLDIVFEVSGGSKDQPVGRHALLTEKLFQSFSGDVIFASFCKLIRIQKDLVSPYMISLAFSEMYKNEVISKYQVQSTGISNFRFENFIDEVGIMIPDQDTRKKFDCVIEDIFTLIHETGMRNMNFKKSRDLLIPQLVTGKLEINI